MSRKITVSLTLADGVGYDTINKWLDDEEWSQQRIVDYDILHWDDDYEIETMED